MKSVLCEKFGPPEDLQLKELEDRLREIEELIANGELPEVVIEEWEELTDDQLKLLGIKKIVL